MPDRSRALDRLRLDLCVATAREWIRIGKALTDLPATTAALDDGALSFSKIRALTRIATADNEAELVELAAMVPAGRLGHALAAWSQRHEPPDGRDARHGRERTLAWRVEPDGMIDGRFRLPPDAAARLIAAIDATVMRTPASPNVTGSAAPSVAHATAVASHHPALAQQRAEAFLRTLIHDTEGRPVIRHDIPPKVRLSAMLRTSSSPGRADRHIGPRHRLTARSRC